VHLICDVLSGQLLASQVPWWRSFQHRLIGFCSASACAPQRRLEVKLYLVREMTYLAKKPLTSRSTSKCLFPKLPRSGLLAVWNVDLDHNAQAGQLFFWRMKDRVLLDQSRLGIAVYATLDVVFSYLSFQWYYVMNQLTNLRASSSSTTSLFQSPHRPSWPVLVIRSSLISQPSHTDDPGHPQFSRAADAHFYCLRLDSSSCLEDASSAALNHESVTRVSVCFAHTRF
jgi:hypothetical protein